MPDSPTTPSAPSAFSRRSFLKSGTLSLAGLSCLGGASGYSQNQKGTSPPAVRNVIFLVSDGMSPGVLPLVEAFSLQMRKRGTHWQALAQRAEASCGWMDTASANSLVTDSAAASSAWGSGVRVNNGVLNIAPDGEVLVPLGPRFRAVGKGFGLVTTAPVTHATPAGFAVAESSRQDQENIAVNYLNVADVYLGGGLGFFDPALRTDGRDVLESFRKAHYAVLRSRDELLNADPSQRLLGLFDVGNLPFTIDRTNTATAAKFIPTLAEMTQTALNHLARNPQGFLLQVEGARIDHAAHNNDIAALLWDQIDFDDALGIALAFTSQRDDTLVIVTSDHGNSNPGLNGMGEAYSVSNECFRRIAAARSSFAALRVRSQEKLATQPQLSPDEWSPLMAKALGIWPSPAEARTLLRLLREEPSGDWNAQQGNYWGILGQVTGNHTGVGWTGISHTSDPTLITTLGPGRELFHGFLRNDALFEKICQLCGIPT